MAYYFTPFTVTLIVFSSSHRTTFIPCFHLMMDRSLAQYGRASSCHTFSTWLKSSTSAGVQEIKGTAVELTGGEGILMGFVVSGVHSNWPSRGSQAYMFQWSDKMWVI